MPGLPLPELDLSGIPSLFTLAGAGSVSLEGLVLVNLPPGPAIFYPIGLLTVLCWSFGFSR